MKKLFGFLIFLPTIGFSQTIDIDRETLVENNISKIILRFNSINSLADYDSLIIGEHHFNKHGFKTFQKLVFPFQDVVATTDQTFCKYDNDTVLRKKIKTHNAVRLTKKDDDYIDFFGIDYDTTIIEYEYYKNGLLKSDIKYSNTNEDTITRDYYYNDSKQLKKLIQSNSSFKNGLHQDNFKELYFYSSNGLLDSIQHFPTSFESHSTKIYKYDKNKNLIEKIEMNGFSFMITVNYGGENKVDIRQAADKGSIEKYHFDSKGNMIKKEYGYNSPSKIDLNYIYKYNDKGELIEEYTENLTQEIIVIIEHEKYRYNANGLLIASEILRDKKVQFEYLIEYE